MKRIYEYIQRNPNICFMIFGAWMVFLYELPFIILGDNSWIRIHDCLDDKIAHMRMIIDTGALFDYNKVLPILYGIKRSEYILEYSLTWIIFSLFPTYWAFVLNDFLARLIACMGMYVLLSDYACAKDNLRQKVLACVVSVLFSYISFYTIYGLSAAGVPVVAYAFLNLANGKRKGWSYVLIALFAFYSNLVLVGVFLGLVLVLYWIHLMISKKEFCKDYFIGLCLLGGCYLMVNIDILITFFMSDSFVSHRIEFRGKTKLEVLKAFGDFFLKTQYHSGKLHTGIIIGGVVLALLPSFKMSRELKLSLMALGGIILLSSIGGYLNTITQIEFLRIFQLDRFYFLLPALWMIVFFCSMKMLAQKKSKWFSKFIMPLLLCSLFLQIYVDNPELKSNMRMLIAKKARKPTFYQFYDTPLFDRIAQDIGAEKGSCKVVSVGMHPAVAEYNGFHCLDGYVSNYRLDYKHAFREVIQAELDKSERLKQYYDTWGSRCYVFSADKNVEDVTGKEPEVHTRLDINVDKLRALGCQYVFSAVTIDNYEEIGLLYLNSYSSPKSYWNIKVYKL